MKIINKYSPHFESISSRRYLFCSGAGSPLLPPDKRPLGIDAPWVGRRMECCWWAWAAKAAHSTAQRSALLSCLLGLIPSCGFFPLTHIVSRVKTPRCGNSIALPVTETCWLKLHFIFNLPRQFIFLHQSCAFKKNIIPTSKAICSKIKLVSHTVRVAFHY